MHSKKSELLALYLITQGGKPSYKLLGVLEPAHFMFPATQTAFKRYLKLISTKNVHLDWHSLCEDPAIDSSHREFLSAFKPDRHTVRKVNVDQLLATLEKYRAGRSLISLVNFTSEALSGEFEPDELFDQIADKLAKARTKTGEQNIYHFGTGNNTSAIVKEILDQDAEVPVTPTGFVAYDSYSGGYPKCGVVVLAATSSSGKSAMANQLALNMQDSGRDVLKVSLEMPIDQETIRFLANKSGVPALKIKNKKLSPEELKKVKKAYKKLVLASKKIRNRLSVIAPEDDMSMRQVLMQAKPFGYDVIIVDYISLLAESPGVEQWKHLSDVARVAKQFTMTNNCLIILLAQLDEDSAKVRYSRAIKEHADILWKWDVKDAEREAGKFTVFQEKGRNEGVLSFEVDVDFPTMRMWSSSSNSGDEAEGANGDGTSANVTNLMG